MEFVASHVNDEAIVDFCEYRGAIGACQMLLLLLNGETEALARQGMLYVDRAVISTKTYGDVMKVICTSFASVESSFALFDKSLNSLASDGAFPRQSCSYRDGKVVAKVFPFVFVFATWILTYVVQNPMVICRVSSGALSTR